MPKFVDHTQRRFELADACVALVATEGLEAASMRRLAEAANCTTGSLTHYFPNRTALLIAMLRHVHDAAGKRMLTALAGEETPRKQLEAVLHESLPLDTLRFKEWRVWLAFWGEVLSSPDLAKEHAARYGEWKKLLMSLTSSRKLPLEHQQRFVTRLIATVDGFGLQIAMCSSPNTKSAITLQQECNIALQETLAQIYA
tara:strand:- start:220 stop:816 length:597 start_codon:yes stop_codon:yes gene_type:complete